MAQARRRSSSTLPSPLGSTDPKRWKLDASDEGRHVWHYDRDEDGIDSAPLETLWGTDPANVKKSPQSAAAKHALGLPLPIVLNLEDPVGNPWEAAKKGKRVSY